MKIPYVLRRSVVPLYTILAVALVLYSYTQIELGLTITRSASIGTIQRLFQHVGYFQRPLSTLIFFTLVIVMFMLQWVVYVMIRSSQLPKHTLRRIITILAGVSVVSYPAFSLDIFNYLFDARLVTVYSVSPYLVRPMQLMGIDPWLSFLRWVHVPSAYTPVWIAMAILPYLAGFGVLVLTLLVFKALIICFYIGSSVLVYKILRAKTEKHALLGTVLFSLNPLLMIETLVSGHNDIVMMFFALLSIYLYIHKQYVLSFFSLSVSIATKLMTVFLIPAYVFKWNKHIALIGMVGAFVAVQFIREVLPWYFVWILPMLALQPKNIRFQLIGSALSFGLLMRYVPFLYLGHWDDPVPTIKTIVTIAPVLLTAGLIILRSFNGAKKLRTV